MGLAALALDGFALWLCFIYAPAKSDTNLAVIVLQFPDVGVMLVPVLALALAQPASGPFGCSPGRERPLPVELISSTRDSSSACPVMPPAVSKQCRL